jgi:hypothetical protein
MWVLLPIAWPFLVLYLMVRLWRLTLPLIAVSVVWYLSVTHPLAAWVVGAMFVAILITVLRIRESDDNAREAINRQRAVERDLDQRDRHLEAGRADRARMELQAELIAKALVREAREIRR